MKGYSKNKDRNSFLCSIGRLTSGNSIKHAEKRFRSSKTKKEKERNYVGSSRIRALWPSNSVLGDLTKLAVEKLIKSQGICKRDNQNATSEKEKKLPGLINSYLPIEVKYPNKVNRNIISSKQNIVLHLEREKIKFTDNNINYAKKIMIHLRNDLTKKYLSMIHENCHKVEFINNVSKGRKLIVRETNICLSKLLNTCKVQESRDVECYELIGKIDEGTFGLVFRAKDRSSGCRFAIKKSEIT
jgi:hypothetical protein